MFSNRFWFSPKNRIIDRLTPSIITNGYEYVPSSPERHANGNWYTCVLSSDVTPILYFYESTDNGDSWQQLCYIQNNFTLTARIVLSGDILHVFGGNSGTSTVYSYKFDVTSVSNTNQSGTAIVVDSGQTELGEGDMILSSNGDLHATWVSKNATRPSTFNVRYSRSFDGGNNWTTPVSVTTINNSSTPNLYRNPNLVIKSDGNPSIGVTVTNSSTYAIGITNFNGISWGSVVTIYDGGAYEQGTPSLGILSNGTIGISWEGRDTSSTALPQIKFSQSTNDGVTWSAMEEITSTVGFATLAPSMCVDKNDVFYIVYSITNFATLDTRLSMSHGTSGSFATAEISTGSDKVFDVVICSTFDDFIIPIVSYADRSTSNVAFLGKWIEY